MTGEVSRWAPDWLALLKEEEDVLTAALASVRQVRKALLANELPALGAALAAQGAAIEGIERVRADGSRLRRQLADAMSAEPDALTAAALARQVFPAQAGHVLSRIGHMRELALEVQKQNRKNAFVAHHSIRFVRRLLGVLVGAPETGERYSAAGMPQQPAWGSILNARG